LNSKKINYRPEIDGLRAIAVISVILFHAKLNFLQDIFKGGFFGVDIFFVISGYLISKIIINNINDNNFSFIKFYIKRGRRILPALFTIIIFCIVISYSSMLNITLKEFSQSVLFLTIFLSNIFFWKKSESYNDTLNDYKPLLHTWSISIEEQFYLIFPLFLVLIFSFKKNKIFYFLIFWFLSFIFSIWVGKYYNNFNFFWIFSRIWEFLTGTIVAYCEINNCQFNKNKSKIFSTVSVAIIFLFLFFIDLQYFNHPGLITLLPVLSTGMLIFTINKNNLIKLIFSNKLLVFIGLISYSLYLWHYPIFSFNSIFSFKKIDDSEKIFLLILIFAISYFTWKFIEKPFRDPSKVPNIFFLILVFIFCIFFIIFGIFGHLSNGFLFKYNFDKQNIFPVKNGVWFKNENTCTNRNINDICSIIKNKDNKNIILYGDSSAEHMSLPILELSEKNNFNFFSMTLSGCFMTPGIITFDYSKEFLCKKFVNYSYELLKFKNSTIILSARYSWYLLGEGFDNKEGGIESRKSKWVNNETEIRQHNKDRITNIEIKFIDFINKLSKDNKVVIIYPIPEVGWHVPDKIYYATKDTFENFKLKGLSTDYKVFLERNKMAYNMLDKIKENKNIIKIYPELIFCNSYVQNRCITHDDKEIYYTDDTHLSLFGSRKIAKMIFDKIN